MFQVSNNNYVVELGKQLGFSLVNVSGQDIVQGNKKLIMAFVWSVDASLVKLDTFLKYLIMIHAGN